MADTERRRASGRPRKFDPEDGVQAAKRLFRERGYDGVSVAELAGAIGINPPSLYAAYGSKLGLFRQVLERYQAAEGSFLNALADTDRPIEDSLPEVLRKAVEVYTRDVDCRGCLVMDGAGHGGDAAACEMTEALKARLHGLIEMRFRDAGHADPGAVADYAIFVLAGLSARARSGVAQPELARVAEGAISGLAAMLRG